MANKRVLCLLGLREKMSADGRGIRATQDKKKAQEVWTGVLGEEGTPGKELEQERIFKAGYLYQWKS